MGIDGREFVQKMTLPVWQAGAAARWLEGRVQNRPKLDEATDEKSALTDADCVSQEVLLAALHAFYPGVCLDAEEDTPTALAFAGNDGDECVVVDPIDGTLRYVSGEGLWAIIVGLERAGAVEACVIGIPQLDVVVRAVRGHGAERSISCGPFQPARCQNGRRVLVSHGLGVAGEGALSAAGRESHKAAGGAIGIAPLLDDTFGAIRVSRRPAGLSRRAWVAALPTLEAGGVIAGLSGALPERYEPGVDGVIVAADEAGLEALRACAPKPGN